MAETTGRDAVREAISVLTSRHTGSPTPPASGFSVRSSKSEGAIIGGRYRVEGFLGEGGTATVFLARDEKTADLVVVKTMKPEVAETPELRDRFLLEAHALSKVHHSGVVRVLDISDEHDRVTEGEPPFLVLEALQGESLGDYLKRNESMPLQVALPLMRAAARALGAVHEAGLVHRDIKPDNFYLVGPIDIPQSIKVLDFGMAHFVDDGHDENSTSILGTAQYMAPEQILVEPVDARTDIYGLGVVMFRALTGHLPFDAHSKTDLLRHQLFSPVPPASWLDEDIPVVIERIIHRATRKAPAARFESMEQIANALDAFAQGDEPCLQPYESNGELDPDIYAPQTPKGQHAAKVLATEFGIYSRPHRRSLPSSPL